MLKVPRAQITRMNELFLMYFYRKSDAIRCVTTVWYRGKNFNSENIRNNYVGNRSIYNVIIQVYR